MKYFLKHYGAQISFKFITGNWAIKYVSERFKDSLEILEITRICLENHSNVTG